MLVSIIIVLFVRLGLVPSNVFSENLYLFGLALVAVCWSIALVDQINLMKIEKAKTDLTIQASEARYRQLIEKMNDGLGVMDENSRFSFINDRFAEMIGYAPGEILEHPVIDFVSEEQKNFFIQQLEKRKSGSSTPYELTWRRKSGEEIYTMISPVPIFENGRGYKGAFAVITDITERVMAGCRLEQRVQERTNELTVLLNISREISTSREFLAVLDRIVENLKSVVDYRLLAILAEEVGGWRIFTQDCVDYPMNSELAEISAEDINAIVNEFTDQELILIRDPEWIKGQGEGLEKIISNFNCDKAPGFLSWYVVPLYEKDRLAGILVLGCEKEKLSEDQLRIILASATQISLAIENYRLYQMVRETAMSEERNRLARDLHDSVTQSLFSISLLADVLPKIWKQDPERGMRRVEKFQRQTRGALAEMRALLLELRPTAMINTSLSELLVQLVEAVTSRSGLSFQLFVEKVSILPVEVQTNYYRIAQVALNNVVKHAQANLVTVSLNKRALPDEPGAVAVGEIRMVIQDDGVGFSLEETSPGRLGIGKS